jgi:predicted nucleic acid-binding protein
MPTFVDTSAWLAIKNSRDRKHAAAIRIVSELRTRRELLITSDYILDETYTALLYDLGYAAAVLFKHEVDALVAGGILRVIHITADLQIESWQVFERFNRDKLWSFTDCTSYVVVRKEEIHDCFAFDADFVQMGLNVLSQ